MQSKYRPLSINEFWNRDMVPVVNEQNISSLTSKSFLILEGDKGCGKTTLARILAGSAVSHESNIIEINAKGDEGKTENLRQLLSNSNLTVGISEFDDGKLVVIVDEAHLLNKSSESLFLKPVEDHSDTLLVIFVTNELEKIRKDLKDRAMIISFSQLRSPKNIYDFIYDYKSQFDGFPLTDASIKLLADKIGNITPRHMMGVMDYITENNIGDITEILKVISSQTVDEIDPSENLFKTVLDLIKSHNSYTSSTSSIDKIYINSINENEAIKSVKGIMIYMIKNRNRFRFTESQYRFMVKYLSNLMKEEDNVVPALLLHLSYVISTDIPVTDVPTLGKTQDNYADIIPNKKSKNHEEDVYI